MQIVPAGTLPTLTKKYHGPNGRLVIINLQPTKHDGKADLIIRAKSDLVMKKLFENLGEEIPKYDTEMDPIHQTKRIELFDWTQTNQEVKCWASKATSLVNSYKAERKRARESKNQVVFEKVKLEVPVKKVKEESDHYNGKDFEIIMPISKMKEEVDEKPKISVVSDWIFSNGQLMHHFEWKSFFLLIFIRFLKC